MKSDLRSAILCIGLFSLSFLLLNTDGKGYLPSDDYYETAVSVFNEYKESEAINPSAQIVIAGLLDDIEEREKAHNASVLPPILTPPESVRADRVQ